MEKLVTVKDVSERYGCSLPTARKYIRQCKPYMEKPLTTYDWAFREWEKSRMEVKPMSISKREYKKLKAMISGERVIVPRTW